MQIMRMRGEVGVNQKTAERLAALLNKRTGQNMFFPYVCTMENGKIVYGISYGFIMFPELASREGVWKSIRKAKQVLATHRSGPIVNHLTAVKP